MVRQHMIQGTSHKFLTASVVWICKFEDLWREYIKCSDPTNRCPLAVEHKSHCLFLTKEHVDLGTLHSLNQTSYFRLLKRPNDDQMLHNLTCSPTVFLPSNHSCWNVVFRPVTPRGATDQVRAEIQFLHLNPIHLDIMAFRVYRYRSNTLLLD